MPREIRRWLATIVVLSSLLASALTMTTVTSADAASCGSTFERSRDFRRSFGLSTDADHIRRLLDDPAADCTWGVPLSPDESEEMDRRNSVELYIGALSGYVDANDDAFGGLYIDQPAGGTVVVLTVPETTQAQVDEALSLVDAGAPAWLEVVTREVTYSQRRLIATQDEISDLMRADDPKVDGIVGLGRGTIENRVEVEILVSHFAAVREFLLERYPEDLLTFVERTSGDSAGCSRCGEDPPDTDASGDGGSSSAFVVALAAAFGVTTIIVLVLGPQRRRPLA
ncbi:MAG: hypothetical protein M3395_08880 [Chloroflexota bacterium]|nr:hypothetical protein [Chloroflexota bacterium]